MNPVVLDPIVRQQEEIESLHKTAPKIIWLQIDPEAKQFDGWDAQTWCSDKINDTDLRYVRADLNEAQAAQIVMLRDALDEAATSLETIQLRSYGDESYLNTMEQVRGFAASRAGVAKEALAATDDLDSLILCEKKPVARKISYGSLVFLEGYAELSEGTPLYRAWEPKT